MRVPSDSSCLLAEVHTWLDLITEFWKLFLNWTVKVLCLTLSFKADKGRQKLFQRWESVSLISKFIVSDRVGVWGCEHSPDGVKQAERERRIRDGAPSEVRKTWMGEKRLLLWTRQPHHRVGRPRLGLPLVWSSSCSACCALLARNLGSPRGLCKF